MSKDLFIQAHMELVEKYQLDHPEADFDTAYNATADAAYIRYRDKFADMADQVKDRLKEQGKWP